MSNLLNIGANILDQVARGSVGGAQQSDPVDQQIMAIGRQVAAEMDAYELRANDPSVCGLYLHFFLSIFALFECAVRLAVHFAIMLIAFFGYYFVYCVSCGKSALSQSEFMHHNNRMYALYSGLFFGIVGNIFVPWSPPLYAFAQPPLKRPQGFGTDRAFGQAVRHALCSCCLCVPDMQLPTYKNVQGFLVVYGGLDACGSATSCCGECCGQSCSYQGYVQKLQQDATTECDQATVEFYRKTYNVGNHDELLAQRLGVAAYVPAGQVVAPTQQVVMGRTVQQAPVQVVAYPVSR